MTSNPSPNPLDILHLKASLGSSAKSKLTFGVKVHRLLEYIKQHPQDAATVGLIWSNQPGIFLANNKVLTKFLGIKINSVNTNLREHGFVRIKTIPMTPQKLAELTGASLPDARHWKKFKQKLVTYSQISDEGTAVQIDVEGRPRFLAQKFHTPEGQNPDDGPFESSVPSQVDSVSSMAIPRAILQGNSFFLSDSLKAELGIVMGNLQHEFEIRRRILDLALSQWIGRLGRVEVVAVQAFLDAFLPPSDHSRVSSKHTNCQFLLGSCTPHSRFVQNQASFTDFFRLFLRYGCSNGLHESFDAITPSDSRHGAPCFCDGFCLGWNIATVSGLLRPGDWAIVEGDQLATFSFLAATILVIRVDPSDDLHHFTFTLPSGEQHAARSWSDLLRLTDVHPENGLHIHMPNSAGSLPRTSGKWQQPLTLFDLNDPPFSPNSDDWNLDDL